MRKMTGLLLSGLLVACAPGPGRGAPTFAAQSIAGNGEVLLKLTNTSGGVLLIWTGRCGPRLSTDVTREDGTPVPAALWQEPRYCGFSAPLNPSPQVLPPGDFLLEHVAVHLPAGRYRVRQTITVTSSRDRRTEEQRRLYGTLLADSGCRGIPCPPEFRFGQDPRDPLNLPRVELRVSAAPTTLSIP